MIKRIATGILTAVTGATLWATPSPNPVDAAPATTAAYVAVRPCRLADTRQPQGINRIDATTIQVQARNVCGIPGAATSLALTVTVVTPQASGFLTAWPAAQARPTVSNINFTAGQIRANGSITRLDSTGAFRVFTSATAHVVVDVVGAFVPASTASAGRFVAQSPVRVLDTRGAAMPNPATSLTLPLPNGIPRDAVALALNVTVTESMGPGFVTEFPAGQAMPVSSMLNIDRANQTRAAAGIFPVSPNGVGLFTSGGGHVVVDLLGYFTGPSAPPSTDGLFTAYDPARLLDTRTGVPAYPGGGFELAVGRGGAMAFNLTAVEANSGYVTAYPAGTVRPSTSSVNSTGAGDVVANFSLTQVSDRGLGLFSQAGAHLLVDLQGWFSGPSAAASQPPPTNTPPPVPQTTFSSCTHEGLSWVNQTRAAVGASQLGSNANADAFACSYALELATRANGLTHSNSAVREAAVGCGAGENIAWSSGTSPAQLMSLWYGSAAHLANIRHPYYQSVGIGYVIRTEASGVSSIWGVMVFAVCAG